MFSDATSLDSTWIPQNAVESFKDSLLTLGYNRDSMLDHYLVSVEGNRSLSINTVAFANPSGRVSAEYASFTLYGLANNVGAYQVVPQLARSSAPFHIIHRNDGFDFYVSKYTEGLGRKAEISSVTIVQNIAYSNLNSVLNEYRRDLQPVSVMRAKRGLGQFENQIFRDVLPLQLSLFVQEVNEARLVEYFGMAVSLLRRDHVSESDLPQVATQLLGIAILADTGALGNEARLDHNLGFSQFYSLASQRFPSYFRNIESRHYEDAFKILREGSYSTFEPNMLTALYRAAYNKDKQRELGRYDTPLYLTRRMWEQIPVEFLPPDQRVILDMTCGWGSFLIAGYDRLNNISDTQHNNLPNQIIGNDSDAFTASLAKLGLLLHTSQDRWNVASSDALTWDWLHTHQPNVIVGNPPFSGSRKESKTTASKTRFQKADQFISLAIDRLAPDGYLAMLMPLSFVASESAPKLRKKLLDKCDVYELWELPTGIFRDANADVLAIFAQKQPKKNRQWAVRVRSIQPNTARSRFRHPNGAFTISGLASSEKWDESLRVSKNNTHLFEYETVLTSAEWQQIQQRCQKLPELSYVVLGATRGRTATNERYRNASDPISVKWLGSARNAIQGSFQFKIATHGYEELRYPNDFVWPRWDAKSVLLGPKILMAKIVGRDWGKRNMLAVDYQDYLPSDGFWVFAPRNPDTFKIEALAAILDWVVANAWIVDHHKATSISRRTLDTLPIPKLTSLSDEKQLTLVTLVKVLEDPQSSAIDRENANAAIDDILKDAYGLTEEQFAHLKGIANWKSRDDISLDPELLVNSSSSWSTSGVVEDVDYERSIILLAIDGLEGIHETPIHPNMPGWLLRPNVAFNTLIPYYCVLQQNLDKVAWGLFQPQMYTYLSEDEIWEDLLDIANAKQ